MLTIAQVDEWLHQLNPRLADAISPEDPSLLAERLSVAMRRVLVDIDVPTSAEGLSSLADALDAAAFDLQDATDEGRARQDEYLRAFERARAASALRDVAAGRLSSAVYEALHALAGNEDALLAELAG